MSFTAKAEILLEASPSKVWKALTDPEMVKQYLFGTEMSVSEWAEGGKITYKGVWEGKVYEDKGTILIYEPEKKLVSTYWSGLSGKPDAPENYARVEYDLINEGDGTKLIVIQDNNPTEESAKHSEENWKMVLQKMKEMLEK